MLTPIFDSSAEMSIDKRMEAAKYPWRTMIVGKSFHVPTNATQFKTLQNYAYRMGKKLRKRFRCIDHGPERGYEVGLIEDLGPAIEQATVAVQPQRKPSQWELPKDGKQLPQAGEERFKKIGF